VVAEVDKRPHIFGKAPATPKFWKTCPPWSSNSMSGHLS
jgi:hypothetical protein